MSKGKLMQESDEVPKEIFEFTTLSLFAGFLELVEAIAANRSLTDSQLSTIHQRMTAPLDDEECRDHETMCVVRNELDRAFASARAYALHRLNRD